MKLWKDDFKHFTNNSEVFFFRKFRKLLRVVNLDVPAIITYCSSTAWLFEMVEL